MLHSRKQAGIAIVAFATSVALLAPVGAATSAKATAYSEPAVAVPMVLAANFSLEPTVSADSSLTATLVTDTTTPALVTPVATLAPEWLFGGPRPAPTAPLPPTTEVASDTPAVAQVAEAPAKKKRKKRKKRIKWSTAKVSWYGPGFYGHTMAGGGQLRRNSLVVAHRSLPFGTRIQFKYKGRKVIAVVKDRGPFVRGRLFDLGPGTAKRLRFGGVGYVKYRILKKKHRR